MDLQNTVHTHDIGNYQDSDKSLYDIYKELNKNRQSQQWQRNIPTEKAVRLSVESDANTMKALTRRSMDDDGIRLSAKIIAHDIRVNNRSFVDEETASYLASLSKRYINEYHSPKESDRQLDKDKAVIVQQMRQLKNSTNSSHEGNINKVERSLHQASRSKAVLQQMQYCGYKTILKDKKDELENTIMQHSRATSWKVHSVNLPQKGDTLRILRRSLILGPQMRKPLRNITGHTPMYKNKDNDYYGKIKICIEAERQDKDDTLDAETLSQFKKLTFLEAENPLDPDLYYSLAITQLTDQDIEQIATDRLNRSSSQQDPMTTKMEQINIVRMTALDKGYTLVTIDTPIPTKHGAPDAEIDKQAICYAYKEAQKHQNTSPKRGETTPTAMIKCHNTISKAKASPNNLVNRCTSLTVRGIQSARKGNSNIYAEYSRDGEAVIKMASAQQPSLSRKTYVARDNNSTQPTQLRAAQEKLFALTIGNNSLTEHTNCTEAITRVLYTDPNRVVDAVDADRMQQSKAE